MPGQERSDIAMNQLRQHHNIACTQCGCVCDDLTIQRDSAGLTAVNAECPIADQWFRAISVAPEKRVAETGGRSVSLDAAVAAAAELLKESRSPLIYGLSRSSTGGQRAACHLADLIGATIDTTASTCHAPSIMALQSVGEATSSLGEVRNRSDLVIYWGSDPLRTHPRHFSRIVETPGRFIPGGRSDRHVVVVDVRETASSKQADSFFCVEPGSDFEILWTLRALIKGETIVTPSVGGIDLCRLQELAERMLSSRYGVVFFGLGLTDGACGHHHVEALLQLVTDLNQHTRFVARRMRVSGDVAGADSVLCWQTGYPFSVSLSRGFPRYNPGEFTASAMLERDEIDCAILIGAESISRMSPAARRCLSRIPVILLDYAHQPAPMVPQVRFTTAIYGVHRTGVAYRMDEVPIPLRAFVDSELPSDEEVLNRIADAVQNTFLERIRKRGHVTRPG
jgi:formylmethanofuran dehydrogenase subunit B